LREAADANQEVFGFEPAATTPADPDESSKDDHGFLSWIFGH
jgi:hypothetical protein